jgi:hypothetical protein
VVPAALSGIPGGDVEAPGVDRAEHRRGRIAEEVRGSRVERWRRRACPVIEPIGCQVERRHVLHPRKTIPLFHEAPEARLATIRQSASRVNHHIAAASAPS